MALVLSSLGFEVSAIVASLGITSIAVAFAPFAWARKRQKSLLGAPMQLPTSTRLDRRLLLGSLVFGAGWGLAGFCPGPALVALGMGVPQAYVFVLAMLVGMGLFEVLERWRAAR